MSERIVRDGWVVLAEDNWIVVQVGRPDACGHCAASGACAAFSGGAKTHRARARNLCRAAVGQHVRLEMEAGPLLAAAFLVYFLPALGMLAAAFAGHELAQRFFSVSPDAGAVAGAVLALVVSALLLVWRGRLRRKDEILLAAVEILDDAPPGCTGDF